MTLSPLRVVVVRIPAVVVLVLFLIAPASAGAQGLVDFDYENLSFRGMMLDRGSVSSSHIEPTSSFGGRFDLGLLGPGVRVVAGFNHWSSTLADSEVGELESKLEALISDETGGPANVELGEITWSDVAFHGDLHFLWRVPLGLLTYAGLGASTHVLRGGGAAIDDTFIDDLLDSVRAGVNVHGGLEVPLHQRFRVVGEAGTSYLRTSVISSFGWVDSSCSAYRLWVKGKVKSRSLGRQQTPLE